MEVEIELDELGERIARRIEAEVLKEFMAELDKEWKYAVGSDQTKEMVRRVMDKFLSERSEQ